MANRSPRLKVSRPQNVFFKPLTFEFKGLFKGLAKGVGHGLAGKWEELASDTVETLAAIGLATDPGELVFLLIRRSITKALFDLVADNAELLIGSIPETGPPIDDPESYMVEVNQNFLDRPSEIPLVGHAQSLLRKWLESQRVNKAASEAISLRLPSYFLYSLNQEWRRNSKSYAPIIAALQTPFTKAGEREWAWAAYAALLGRRVDEGVFDEPFSLRQIFVSPHAYYLEKASRADRINETIRPDRRSRRVVVSLDAELNDWLKGRSREDAIRVISGGPGSGKSSFARIFAARIAERGELRVLFVPLHLIDPAKDFVEEIGRFVREENVLTQNPLDVESPESNLLIILDGLDELASQGKAAAETARAFIRELERTAEKKNLQSLRLRLLISGRELVVQENESEFRGLRQVLTLLPYFVPNKGRDEGDMHGDHYEPQYQEEYLDTSGLLKLDLRNEWWEKYGLLTGHGYGRLPAELNRPDLEEITAQPLLNYLVALSFTRDKLDFTKDVGLNAIYEDLVTAVHERGYEKHRPYAAIRHMSCSEFSRVLEEVGLAAWHGDGRTTSVREIEAHCRISGVGALLDKFQEGAQAGVTRLLAAFFFRQYGQRPGGDPTFVFTHKSFGEYLAARRIARAVERVVRECEDRIKNPDRGWDEREALRHWAQICGPSAISRYIHVFLLNEARLWPLKDVSIYQLRITVLFSHLLEHGMPMEQLQIVSFKDMLFQARNAEEALLVALNGCARVTREISRISFTDPTLFGAWFRRIQGQRTGPESILAASCLSFLDLEGAALDLADFWGANLEHSNLQMIAANYAIFGNAELNNADLRKANLANAVLCRARLNDADLTNAHVQDTDFEDAIVQGIKLKGTLVYGLPPEVLTSARRNSRLPNGRLRPRRVNISVGEAGKHGESK